MLADKTVQNQASDLAPLLPAGLASGLRNYWYPILQAEELPADQPVSVKVLGERFAVWRDGAGNIGLVRDRCPHRGVQLSLGRILDGNLQCRLHGLRFDRRGTCTLIPWEGERSRIHDRLTVASCPAAELGGYVWGYLGDTAGTQPAPLAAEVPEELSKPDEFIWFRLPTQVWKANWLLAIDGSDGFHAVTLHARSQTHGDGVPLKDRRVRIVRTTHGIRGVSVDGRGNQVEHGHFTVDVRGDRFVLPCITTNPIVPAPGAAPYAARLWQFPIDETHTQIVRFLTWRARTEAERQQVRDVFERFAKPRLEKVAQEDAMIAEAQGDLLEARQNETLLAPDADVVRVRKLIADAYNAPARQGVRVAVSSASLAFPV